MSLTKQKSTEQSSQKSLYIENNCHKSVEGEESGKWAPVLRVTMYWLGVLEEALQFIVLVIRK